MKKLLSIFLAVLMVMALFTVASAEDVTTITQNGVSLDGKTNMPLSFTPTVTFAVPVDEGTDLTGITVTSGGVAIDGVTVEMGTVTKPTNEDGEVDESATGTFTTATVKIPVLEYGTYALEVPAIGDNLPASASFSTIPSPYFIKEDFNGEINGNWNSSRNSGRVGTAVLKDSDGDGNSDSASFTGYYHPTYSQVATTPNASTELIYETRVKWTPRNASNANEDGTIKGNDDNNNGGLLRLYSAGSYWARIKADASGNLCYGNTNADTVTTDYKLYKDTWYTIRFTFNDTRRQYKVDICDDNGNVYNGDYASTSYNGGVFNAVGDVCYSYGAYYMSTIDYLYAWDGNLVAAPSVTYNNGTDLDGAENVNAKDDLTVAIEFTNPITAFDLDSITLNGGLEVTKTLAEDNKTVTLVISNMAYNAAYTLKVPAIGMNKGVTATFKTGSEPAKAITQNGANLDGQTDMPVAFTATVAFATPVAEGTVLPSATLTPANGDAITVALTAGTATDGYFTKATVATPLLTNATTYTLSVPAIGSNSSESATFTTVAEHFIAKEEFNGVAKGNWHNDSSDDTKPRSQLTWLDTDEDGMSDAVYLQGVRPALRFPNDVVRATTCSSANVSATFFGELTYETKVKFTSNDGKPNADGSLYSGDANNGMLLGIRSKSTNRNAIVRTSTDGFMQYGGGGTNITTDYKIYENTWYTFRITLTNDTKKMKVFVIDENGNAYDGAFTGVRFNWPIDDVTVTYPYRYLSWSSMSAADYMYLYDNADSSLGEVTATYNDGIALDGATDVDKEEALNATLTFANEISASDLEKIVVSSGATVEKTLSDDNKTVFLAISGLEFNEKYYISVSTLGLNKAKVFSFTTEAAPVTAYYNNGTEDVVLADATEVPVDFSGKITYGIALDPETDVSGITVNGGNVTATLNADGTEISYKVSGLNSASAYTLSVPALGVSNALEVNFATVMNQYLFKAEFDENDINAYELSDTNNTITEGILNLPGTPGGTTTRVNPISTIDLSGRSELVFETRVKFTMKTANATNTISSGKILFALLGDEGTLNSGFSLWSSDGYLGYGGNGDNSGKGVKTEYLLTDGMWYTIRMEFAAGSNAPKLIVTPDTGEGITIDNASMSSNGVSKIYGIRYSYRYQVASNVDYIRIWDDSLLPKAEATIYNGEELDGAGSVKNGEKITISFPEAITEENLASIKLDDASAEGLVLSEDGKTVTMSVPALTPRTFHTLKVEKIGMMPENSFRFRAADEGKYLVRYEFDGNDDDTAWFTRVNSSLTGKGNSAVQVQNGMWSQDFSTTSYGAFTPTFENYNTSLEFRTNVPRESNYLDVAGKKNITIETKIRVGEGTLDNQFMYIGNNIAMITFVDGAFAYNGDGGSNGGKKAFMVNADPLLVERNNWYTFKFDFDFEAYTYNVSVDDSNGNIANSGPVKFIYNTQKDTISDFRFQRQLNNTYAPLDIEYFYIIDNDYGKVDVTYDAGVPASLDGSALVPVADNIFEFTLAEAPASLTGITLVDENGNETEVATVVNSNTVSIIPGSNLKYNTKYVLTLPKEIIGAENDQEVKFTTVWNQAAEFVYPEGFEKDDEFNVVYFGGSITNQNGWRVTTTNWFKEFFPNSKHFNASVGGTGADWGWNRLARDVIPHNPDIVFIEFAVNDSNNMNADRDIESIVRNLNKLDKPPVIIFVYTTVQNFSNNINAIALQESVAKAYGIPSINIHDYTQTRYNTESQFAKDWDSTVYIGSDTTHPTDAGSTLYGNYVTALLESDSSKYFVRPTANAFVAPVASDFRDFVYDYTAINQTISGVGSSYEFTVSGDAFLLEYSKKSDAGTFSITVDGNVVAENIDAYNSANYVPNSTKTVSGLGEGTHTVTVTVTGQNASSTGANVKLAAAFTRNYSTKITRPVFDTNEVAAGKEITVATSYQGSDVQDGILLVATYDSYGRLVRLIDTTKDGAFKTGSTEAETFVKVKVTPTKDEVKVKAFVWDGLSTMVPLTKALEIQ
ncbi:MAG: hypothetical protein J6A69_02450 [Clostridia bacterium]|nr:hypothetical protein [Clostridia bacterium]